MRFWQYLVIGGLNATLAVIPTNASSATSHRPVLIEVLDLLKEGVSEGGVSQQQYDALLEDLELETDCRELHILAENHTLLQSDVRALILQACDSTVAQDTLKSWTPTAVRLNAFHNFHPGEDDPSLWFTGMDVRNSAVNFTATARDRHLHRRYLDLQTGPWSIMAGHLWPGMRSIRLPFVVGRRSFYGQSSLEAFPGEENAYGGNGLPFSEYNSPSGLGLAFAGNWIDAGMYGTWNKNSFRRQPLDALLYGAGLKIRMRNLTWQAHHNLSRYEFHTRGVEDFRVSGMRVAGPRGNWRAGLGHSLYRDSSGRLHNPGLYGEAEMSGRTGRRISYLAKWRQAGSGWANPFMEYAARSMDTVTSGLSIMGRGEGGVLLQSRFPLGESNVGELGEFAFLAQTDIHWSLRSSGFLRDEDFTYRHWAADLERKAGSWKHSAGLYSIREGNRENLILSAHLARQWGEWTFAAGYKHKLGDYAGTLPRPLECEIKTSRTHPAAYRIKLVTGDILRPAHRMRAYFFQDWDVNRRGRVLTGVKLPWEDGRLGKDMYYQVRLEYGL